MIRSRDLSWNSHINYISTKASQKLGFIKSNLKGSPLEVKCLAYVSLVRSTMKYASVVCGPHLPKDTGENPEKGSTLDY